MGIKNYDSDDEGPGNQPKVFYEFDCPLCNANNPYGDGFAEKDVVRCCYCGQEYIVKITSEGKPKLKEP